MTPVLLQGAVRSTFVTVLVLDGMTYLDLSCTFPTLKNIVGKGENVGNPVFSPLLRMFYSLSKLNCTIGATLNSLSANAFSLDKVKILLVGESSEAFDHFLELILIPLLF